MRSSVSAKCLVFSGFSCQSLYQFGAHLARVTTTLFSQTLTTRLSIRLEMFVAQTEPFTAGTLPVNSLCNETTDARFVTRVLIVVRR